VHDPTVALKLPSNCPPVSSGFKAPPSSPSTDPVMPFNMTNTPVTAYRFSVIPLGPVPKNGSRSAIEDNSVGAVNSWKNSVMLAGTLGGGWKATYCRDTLPVTVVVVDVVVVVVGVDVVVVVEVVVWLTVTPPGPPPPGPTPSGPTGPLFSQATNRAARTTPGRSSLRIGVAFHAGP
jgi:hypothetical protein